jgi:hypothetical protein
VFVLDFPLVPEVRTSIWNIQAHLAFEAGGGPVKVSLVIPRNSPRFAILNENFISKGYGVGVAAANGTRRVQWSIPKAKGLQSLYYRATVIRADREVPPSKPPTGGQGEPFLEGAHLEAARALVAEVRERSTETRGMVTGLIARLNSPEPGGNAALLLGQKPTVDKKVDLTVRLLTLAGIHARPVHGIRLEAQRRGSQVLSWLEVYEQEDWISYEPVSGQRNIPEDYLAWWRGSEEFVQVQGVKRPHVSLAVVRSEEAALQLAVERAVMQQPFLFDFSLFGLPVQTQAVYRVVLLVPIGVLFLVILRNVVGIRTFGTFMPVLIALAFRETQLLWGIFLFTTLVAIGLLARLYLERLKLLVVPRLAAILIFVIGFMAIFSVLTNKLGIERGISVALFPMVILTMTIERMSIVWEELGAMDAIKQGLGSLIAAIIAYLIMSISYVAHLMFVFPEVLLIVLAAVLWLGRYSGFRLLEFRRFKALTDMERNV